MCDNAQFINNLNFQIMSKKTLTFVTGIVTAVQTAAVAAVTYYVNDNAAVINSAIVIAGGAIIEICNLFVKPE